MAVRRLLDGDGPSVGRRGFAEGAVREELLRPQHVGLPRPRPAVEGRRHAGQSNDEHRAPEELAPEPGPRRRRRRRLHALAPLLARALLEVSFRHGSRSPLHQSTRQTKRRVLLNRLRTSVARGVAATLRCRVEPDNSAELPKPVKARPATPWLHAARPRGRAGRNSLKCQNGFFVRAQIPIQADGVQKTENRVQKTGNARTKNQRQTTTSLED